MKRSNKVTLVLVACAIVSSGTSLLLAGKKDERIPLEEVPEKALAAAKAAVEGIVLTEAEIEKVKKDLVVYELEGVAAGVKYEIEVTSEGKVIEVEEDDDEDEEDHDDDDHEAETGNEHDDDESDDD